MKNEYKGVIIPVCLDVNVWRPRIDVALEKMCLSVDEVQRLIDSIAADVC